MKAVTFTLLLVFTISINKAVAQESDHAPAPASPSQSAPEPSHPTAATPTAVTPAATGSVEDVRAKLKLGRRQRNDAQYKDAEDTFKSALRMCPESDKELQAESIESLAGLYLATNRLEESESLYGKAMKLLEDSSDRLKLAIVYDNVSNICLARHKVEDAQSFNQKSIDILETEVKKTPGVRIDLAKALNQKALLCTATGKLPEAENVFKRAINLYPTPATVDEQLLVATALDNLGGVYLKENKFAEAESSRLKALAIYEKASGGKSQDLAKCLQNVASVYGHQHQYEKALPYVKRAESIDESTLGLRNPATLSALKNYIILLKLSHKDNELKELSARLGQHSTQSKNDKN